MRIEDFESLNRQIQKVTGNISKFATNVSGVSRNINSLSKNVSSLSRQISSVKNISSQNVSNKSKLPENNTNQNKVYHNGYNRINHDLEKTVELTFDLKERNNKLRRSWTRDYRVVKSSLDDTNKSFKNFKSDLSRGVPTNKVDRLSDVAEKMRLSWEHSKKLLRDMVPLLDRQTKESKIQLDTIKRQNRELRYQEKQRLKNNRKINTGGETSLFLGYGLTATFATAGAISIAFSEQIGTLRAETQGTNLDILELRKSILRLAGTSRFTATDVAEATIMATRAGFDLEESLGGIEAVSKLATAESVSMTDAFRAIQGPLAVYGLGLENVTEISDKFSAATSAGATNLAELGRISGRALSPHFEGFGDLNEFLAIAAVLRTRNVMEERVSTVLSNLQPKLSEFARGDGTNREKEMLGLLGITSDQFKDDTGQVLTAFEAIKLFNNAIKQTPNVDAGWAATDLFGADVGRGVIPLLSDDTIQELEKVIGEIQNSTGNVELKFETQLPTIFYQWQSILSAMQDVTLKLFGTNEKHFAEVLKRIAIHIQNFAKYLESNSDKIHRFFDGISQWFDQNDEKIVRFFKVLSHGAYNWIKIFGKLGSFLSSLILNFSGLLGVILRTVFYFKIFKFFLSPFAALAGLLGKISIASWVWSGALSPLISGLGATDTLFGKVVEKGYQYIDTLKEIAKQKAQKILPIIGYDDPIMSLPTRAERKKALLQRKKIRPNYRSPASKAWEIAEEVTTTAQVHAIAGVNKTAAVMKKGWKGFAEVAMKAWSRTFKFISVGLGLLTKGVIKFFWRSLKNNIKGLWASIKTLGKGIKWIGKIFTTYQKEWGKSLFNTLKNNFEKFAAYSNSFFSNVSSISKKTLSQIGTVSRNISKSIQNSMITAYSTVSSYGTFIFHNPKKAAQSFFNFAKTQALLFASNIKIAMNAAKLSTIKTFVAMETAAIISFNRIKVQAIASFNAIKLAAITTGRTVSFALAHPIIFSQGLWKKIKLDLLFAKLNRQVSKTPGIFSRVSESVSTFFKGFSFTKLSAGIASFWASLKGMAFISPIIAGINKALVAIGVLLGGLSAPVTAAVLAISAALIGLGSLIVRNWKLFKSFTKSVWNFVKALGSFIFTSIRFLGHLILKIPILGTAIKAVGKVAGATFKGIWAFFNGIWTGLKAIGSWIENVFIKTLEWAIEKFDAMTSGLINAVNWMKKQMGIKVDKPLTAQQQIDQQKAETVSEKVAEVGVKFMKDFKGFKEVEKKTDDDPFGIKSVDKMANSAAPGSSGGDLKHSAFSGSRSSVEFVNFRSVGELQTTIEAGFQGLMSINSALLDVISGGKGFIKVDGNKKEIITNNVKETVQPEQKKPFIPKEAKEIITNNVKETITNNVKETVNKEVVSIQKETNKLEPIKTELPIPTNTSFEIGRQLIDKSITPDIDPNILSHDLDLDARPQIVLPEFNETSTEVNIPEVSQVELPQITLGDQPTQQNQSEQQGSAPIVNITINTQGDIDEEMLARIILEKIDEQTKTNQF